LILYSRSSIFVPQITTHQPEGRSTVADEASNLPSPFDVRIVKQLVGLMSQHELSEIDLRSGDRRIRLRRGALPATALPRETPAVPAALVSPAAPPGPQAAEPPRPAKALHEIKSPTPGTFYSAANPKAEPYVKVGARVTPSSVVCVIEAMKIFNEIQAECTGVITEILVENQQPVEYGQVLFRVDPAA
jgi:acetyl-CoA carboxylase biotin carboxyl carrier protein